MSVVRWRESACYEVNPFYDYLVGVTVRYKDNVPCFVLGKEERLEMPWLPCLRKVPCNIVVFVLLPP